MNKRIHPAEKFQHPTSGMRKRSPILTWCRLRIRVALGILFNLVGIPGLVRECEYHASVADAHVKVRVRDLFTIVEVNGVEIYFHRLTGSIDGVGVMYDCKLEQAPASEPVPESSEPSDRVARKHTA